MELDVAKVEAAEAEINRFINRQSKAKQQANAEALVWEASARRYAEREQEALRQAWIEHHLRLARNHQSLASEHDRAARKLQEREEV